MRCPEFEALIDYADGKIDEANRSLIEQHVGSGCEECSATLAWYSGMVAVASSDTSFDPPTWVFNRALDVFRNARDQAERRGVRGVMARLRALLVFDSFASTEIVMARSGATAARQLLFSAAPYDIDMLVAGSDDSDRVLVTGQVLATGSEDFDDVQGLTVEVVQDSTIVFSTETSEFGEFSVADIPPGVYSLRLVSDTREIVVPDAPILVS